MLPSIELSYLWAGAEALHMKLQMLLRRSYVSTGTLHAAAGCKWPSGPLCMLCPVTPEDPTLYLPPWTTRQVTMLRSLWVVRKPYLSCCSNVRCSLRHSRPLRELQS